MIRHLRNGWFIAHLVVALVPAWIAVVLLSPYPTFPASTTYLIMDRIATETTWGVVATACSILGLWSMFSVNKNLRFISCIILSAFHGLLALCFVFSNIATTGTGVYALLSFMSYALLMENYHDRF